LDWSFVGAHVFFNNKREIRSPSDLKGLKMRVTQTPEMVKMVEGMGAQAIPIGWSELYTAAQQGVVDGLCTPVLMAAQGKLYEVSKFLTVAPTRLEAFSLSINEKFYQSLSDENKKIIVDAASKSLLLFRSCLYLGESLWEEKLQNEMGVKVYYPTPDQLSQFRKIALEVAIPYVASKVGEKWMNEVMEGVEKAASEYYKN
ncbi:MAG: TRAP transporter substrate-binding protein, partial [Methanosarcinaceae archaeon]|nr:TRAP transporter substrate-binding protein [Methanosarcinaceae archaeon]